MLKLNGKVIDYFFSPVGIESECGRGDKNNRFNKNKSVIDLIFFLFFCWYCVLHLAAVWLSQGWKPLIVLISVCTGMTSGLR